MKDSPLDCFGLPLTSKIGKHDFQRDVTTNTTAQPTRLDESWLENALKAMKNLPPIEQVVHHAKVGTQFWEALKSGSVAPSAGGSRSVFGFPLFVDESLPPGCCEFRNKDGKVLSTLRLDP
ncbi:hypothetical protein GobsT_50120 [Gemmata obscuriglobus]|uniref:hypothetical protein n=1 Tax=Gemmata obscuriglobus TaxID=114 RepID=UPI0011CCE320|nr:hypothetical protein [Gemmata obscuriglobus]QEG30209.1 hypothetical protein GobsT_50120 [Gemmata obscuriglobus]VTS09533.1 unnamed protein product [Gemmata obscuriglobus UQM 2246]